jgi:hypothetical protein
VQEDPVVSHAGSPSVQTPMMGAHCWPAEQSLSLQHVPGAMHHPVEQSSPFMQSELVVQGVHDTCSGFPLLRQAANRKRRLAPPAARRIDHDIIDTPRRV